MSSNVREIVLEENVQLIGSSDSVFESESPTQNWIEKTLATEPSTVDSLKLPGQSGQNGQKMSIGSEMSHGNESSTTDRLLKSSLINGPRTGPRKSVRMLEDIETSDIPIKIK